MDSEIRNRKKSTDGTVKKRLKTKLCKQGRSAANLPLEILIEILSRLPGCSLSRFRVVCKQWLNLITTDPVLKAKSVSPSIIIHSYKYQVKNELTLVDMAGRFSSRVFRVNRKYNKMSPSCNGLVCMYNNTQVMLVNPTTQHKFRLPDPTNGYNSTECILGYAPATKEYKVVRFYCVRSTTDGRQIRCEILTIGTSSWRQITPSFYRGLCTGAIIIDGLMYLNDGLRIMSFDLNNEKFELINCPIAVHFMFDLEGCFGVTRSKYEAQMELWMHEDVLTHAWTRKFELEDLSTGFCHCPLIVKQGKFLVMSGNNLHYRDVETGEHLPNIYHGENMNKAQFHIESLANLHAL